MIGARNAYIKAVIGKSKNKVIFIEAIMRLVKKYYKKIKKLYKLIRKFPSASLTTGIFIYAILATYYESVDKFLLSLFNFIAVPLMIVTIVLLSLKSRHYTKTKATARQLRDICEVDKLSGLEFEHYLSPLFEKQGYKVKVTQGSGDYGADLIIQKWERKFVVQAKCYSSNIGVSAVQQIVAAVPYYKADGAIVVTNQYFTKQAKALATVNKVRLIDRDELATMLNNNESAKININSVIKIFKRTFKAQKKKATLD